MEQVVTLFSLVNSCLSNHGYLSLISLSRFEEGRCSVRYINVKGGVVKTFDKAEMIR